VFKLNFISKKTLHLSNENTQLVEKGKKKGKLPLLILIVYLTLM